MPVNTARVISCLTPCQSVYHEVLLNLCFRMYGALRPLLLVEIITMLVLLMILASSHGSISYVTNLKFSKNFMIFNPWLSGNLTRNF